MCHAPFVARSGLQHSDFHLSFYTNRVGKCQIQLTARFVVCPLPVRLRVVNRVPTPTAKAATPEQGGLGEKETDSSENHVGRENRSGGTGKVENTTFCHFYDRPQFKSPVHLDNAIGRKIIGGATDKNK